MTDRRSFLQKGSALVSGSLLLSALDNNAFAILKNKIAASDQINIGAIGINGMGWSNVVAALKVPGVNLVAVCDVDKNVIDKRLGDYTINTNCANIDLIAGRNFIFKNSKGIIV